MYEHFNKSTNQYEVVQKGSHHFEIQKIELYMQTMLGVIVAGKRCNDTEHHPYCYFVVNGV